MDQRLIKHYNEELAFMQEMGAEFANHFPKVAGRLGLEGLQCADPYVERLLEGFAFLAARVHLELDREYPQFCQHLLEIVYPDYLAPLPSMAVVQFKAETDDPGLAAGFELPRGSAMRSGLGDQMQTACEYRTAQAVKLFPLKVAEADYIGTRAALAKMGFRPDRSVVAGIRIRIETTAEVEVNQLELDELPLYLGGTGTVPLSLFEQIMGNVHDVHLVTGAKNERKFTRLGKDRLVSMGFDPGESMLNYRSRSFDGYRILREYFAFPERFRFLRFLGLGPALKAGKGQSFEIVIELDSRQNELENVINASHFLPFCAPVINLFPKRSDRISLNQRDHEFHVLVDRSRPMDFEIHQVQEVTGFGTSASEQTNFLPFYALKDRHNVSDDMAFYTLQRRPRLISSRQKEKGARSNYLGQEVFISLVDGNEAPYGTELNQLGLVTLCTNRDLPLLIPLGQKGGDFFLDQNAPVREINAIAGPTRPSSLGLSGEARNRYSASTSGELAWRLINHLSLNFLSLVDESPEEGAAALRELLELYSNGQKVMERQINAVMSVRARPITRRLLIPGPISFGRGLEITLVLEEAGFEAGGMFLFGTVVNEFFRKYVSLNNVTETVVVTDSNVEIGRWPVKMGRRPEM